jgi:hypothetical protein
MHGPKKVNYHYSQRNNPQECSSQLIWICNKVSEVAYCSINIVTPVYARFIIHDMTTKYLLFCVQPDDGYMAETRSWFKVMFRL